jgi:L-2-hydroxyglutarate oxidase LhgO
VRVTGIVDYPAMARAMAKELEEAGGEVVLSCAVTGIAEGPDNVSVATSQGLYGARQLVVCGGLQADRLAAMAGWMSISRSCRSAASIIASTPGTMTSSSISSTRSQIRICRFWAYT